jgi:hypothetical protein
VVATSEVVSEVIRSEAEATIKVVRSEATNVVEETLRKTLRINFEINLLFLCNNNVKNNDGVFCILCNSILIPPYSLSFENKQRTRNIRN